jgi:hypothetical protein
MFYVKYKDSELPLIIDYLVIRKFNLSNGITKLSEMGNIDYDDLEKLEQLLFLSLERGHKIEGKPFELTNEDIQEIFSARGIMFFNDIIAECFPKFGTGTEGPKKN